MAKTNGKQADDLPVDTEHGETREARPGRKAYEKAPPDACAIRPISVKFRGLPAIDGELQGTAEHCKVILGKYHSTFPGVIEWTTLEGEAVP